MIQALHDKDGIFVIDYCFLFFRSSFSSVMAVAGISLGVRAANERCHYNVVMSLIGWAHTWDDPCSSLSCSFMNIIV